MIVGLAAAFATCLLGAWLIMALVHAMHEFPTETPLARVLYLLAVVWLLLFGLFLTNVLGSVLERAFL
jgi:hypothetical protein